MKTFQKGRKGEGEKGSKNRGGDAQSRQLLPFSPSPFLPLLLLALAVRITGLTWGLPNAARWYSYHPDESTRQIVGAVVSLLQGDFNPHFFNYPSLSIYATWLIYQLLAGLSLTTDAISPQYPWPVVRDIILAGRIFSVVCGALTAPLVFLIARRLKAGNWAILAGILAALAPGHVQHSHFATVDVPATFFVTLCLFLTLRARNRRDLLWAALVAGLAAGTKYNAGLVLIAPLLKAFSRMEENGTFSPLLTKDGAGEIPSAETSPSVAQRAPDFVRRGVLTAISAVFVALFAFLLSTPYALLAPREFWGEPAKQSGFAYELLHHPREGSGDIFHNTGNGWIYHLTFNLPFILTWAIILAALMGTGFAAKKREWWPVLAFAGLFFFSLGFSQVRFMRYLLPLAPVLCLLAAYGASRLPRPRIWGAVLSFFALWGTKDVLWPLIQIDPRDQAAALLRGKRVALMGNPWFYTPPFQPQGFNAPVTGIKVTGGKVSKTPFVVSEFEWRESSRLGRSSYSVPKELATSFDVRHLKNQIPLALPGREFVPHDYLYTNPETRVYLPRR